MAASKSHGEKAEWERHKNATYCFEEIMRNYENNTHQKQQLYSQLHPISNSQ